MQLSKFLARARASAYPASGEARERILSDGGKEFAFEENGFSYRDRYFGFNPFAGQELVFKNGEAIWAMNYYGRVASDSVPAKQVYAFLRKALRLVEESRPFRGPSSFREGILEYVDESNGTIECFTGTEKILFKEKEIYRLNYHGGSVKKKAFP